MIEPLCGERAVTVGFFELQAHPIEIKNKLIIFINYIFKDFKFLFYLRMSAQLIQYSLSNLTKLSKTCKELTYYLITFFIIVPISLLYNRTLYTIYTKF